MAIFKSSHGTHKASVMFLKELREWPASSRLTHPTSAFARHQPLWRRSALARLCRRRIADDTIRFTHGASAREARSGSGEGARGKRHLTDKFWHVSDVIALDSTSNRPFFYFGSSGLLCMCARSTGYCLSHVTLCAPYEESFFFFLLSHLK